MAQAPLPDRALQEAVDLFESHGTVAAAARAAGIPESTLRNRMRSAARKGLTIKSPPIRMPAGFEVAQVSERQNAKGEPTGRTFQIKPERSDEIYETPPGFFVRERTVRTDADGRFAGEWVKEAREAQSWCSALQEAFSDVRPAVQISAPKDTEADLTTVYPIADAHLGQLSWARETGEKYDLEEAQRVVCEGMRALVAQAPASETGIVLVLGDFTHANDATELTPKNRHKLDVDGRHHKVMLAAAETAEDIVLIALQRHENVIVKITPGNHDEDAYLVTVAALRARFRDEPRVTVNEEPGYFWFHQFGQCLIGATHGHTVRMEELPLIMAARMPKEWGASRHRYFYTGHVHHKRGHEAGDVECRSFPAITARDSYAASRGHTTRRGMLGITLHAKRGLIGEVNHYL